MDKIFSKKLVILNFFLTFLIVFLHSDCMPYANPDLPLYGFSMTINSILSVVCDIAVPSFFAMSFFFFFYRYNNSKYLDKIKTRVKSLLIPYLIWSFVFLIYFIVLFKFNFINLSGNSSIMPLKNNIFDIFIYNIFLDSYDGPLWYLLDLFILFLFSYLIYFLFKEKKIIIFIFCLLISLILNCYFRVDYNSFLYWLPILIYSSFFTINFTDKIVGFSFKNFDKIFLFLIFINIGLFILSIFFPDNYIYIYFFRMLTPIVIYMSLKYINFDFNISKYSKNLFFIFCTHFAIVVIFKRILISFTNNTPLLLLFYRFLIAIIVFYFLNIVGTFISKHFTKLYLIITGNRGDR